jgi:D-glycero-alpha-D-manno-heptose-7-phosphate kinase
MRDALLASRVRDFGDLLHAEWETKQRLSPKIGTQHLDEIYAAARQAGATGGKAAGAGGGGFMLLFCPFDRKHQVAQRLGEMGCVVSDLAFSREGVQTWTAPDE